MTSLPRRNPSSVKEVAHDANQVEIDLVPILLGQGVRLFDYSDSKPIELERT